MPAYVQYAGVLLVGIADDLAENTPVVATGDGVM